MLYYKEKKKNLQWAIFKMLLSSGFVMSQNKMAMLVWGLCTGNHWERYWFTMKTFIKSKKGRGEVYIQYN